MPERSWLRARLRDVLTDEGWRFTQTEALAVLVPGAARLMPDTTDRALRATAVVLLDYLTITSTLPGHVAGDWAARAQPVSEWLAAGVADRPLPYMAAVLAERNRAAAARASARRSEQRLGLDLIRDREELAVLFQAAAGELDGRRFKPPSPELKARAAGIRKELLSLAERVRSSRARATLEELRDLGAAPIAAALEVRRQADSLRQQDERDSQAATDARRLAAAERNRERVQRAAAERAARQAARLRATALRDTLAKVVAEARPMESDYRSGQRAAERVRAAKRSSSRPSDEDSRAARMLAEIAGPLRELHRQEDELTMLLSRQPRQNRLTLPAQLPAALPAAARAPRQPRRPARWRRQARPGPSVASPASPIRAQLGGYRGELTKPQIGGASADFTEWITRPGRHGQ